MPRDQPQLQVLDLLLLLLPTALQQVPSQDLILAIHHCSALQLLLKQQGLPRLQGLFRLQGLPRLQGLVILDQLLRLLSLSQLLRDFKLLATQALTKPRQDSLQIMPLLGQ